MTVPQRLGRSQMPLAPEETVLARSRFLTFYPQGYGSMSGISGIQTVQDQANMSSLVRSSYLIGG